MSAFHKISSGAVLVVTLVGFGTSRAAAATAISYTANVTEGRHKSVASVIQNQGDTPQEATTYNIIPGDPQGPIYNQLHASATDADHGTAIAQVDVSSPGARDTVLGNPYYSAESSVLFTLEIVPNVQSASTVYQGSVVAQIPMHITAHGEASYSTSGGPLIQGFGGVAEFSVDQCTYAGCGAQTFDKRVVANNNPFAPAPVPSVSFDVDQDINFFISAPDFGIDSPINIKLYAYAVDDVFFYPTKADYETYPGSAFAKVDPTFTIDDPVLASLYHIVGIPSGDTAPSSPSAVPEPTTWSLILAGFGLVGAAMRRGKAHARLT